jgi:hypothetical protein
MPEFTAVQNFIPENNHLHNLPLFKWGPLLFTQLKKGIGPEVFFQEMQKRVGWLPIDKLIFDAARSNDYYIKANWALYCENYLEGFHIPFVHPGLNAFLDFKERCQTHGVAGAVDIRKDVFRSLSVSIRLMDHRPVAGRLYSQSPLICDPLARV